MLQTRTVEPVTLGLLKDLMSKPVTIQLFLKNQLIGKVLKKRLNPK